MRCRVVGRILNGRTLAAYLAVCLLLSVVTRGAGSAADILGGFAPAQGGSLNVLAIMRWNLGVLPPVAAGILFMDEELGALRNFTLPRSGSVGRWCLRRFAAVGAADLAYLLMAEAVSALCALGGAGSADEEGFYFFGIFLIVFFVHSFTMSAVSAALLAWKGGPRAPLFLFLVVEGFLTAAGNLFPHVSAYLPPYWGMARQERFWAEDGMFYLLWTAGLQAALAAGAIWYVAVRLRGETPRRSVKGMLTWYCLCR